MPNELNTSHRNLETGNGQPHELPAEFLNHFQDWSGPSRRGRYMACCPAHADSTPSLSIRLDEDGNRIWVECYAGCDKDDILAAAGLSWSDLFLHGGGGGEAEDIPAVQRQLIRDRRNLLRHLDKDATQNRIDALAANLGVTQAALRAFGVGWYSPWSCYTFPMRNGDRRVVGHATRKLDGSKACLYDSNMGLFIPRDLVVEDKLYVCEGASDAMAAWDMGLPAIGRRNCNEGLEEIEDLLGKRKVEVVIIPDNDRTEDGGDGPGMRGAKTLAHRLHGRVAPIPQPDLYKDLREYHNAGQTDLSWLGSNVPQRRLLTGSGNLDLDRYPFANLMTSAELDADNEVLHYIIKGVLVEGQPMVMGGRQKTVKTGIAIDLVLSLGSGGMFLGKFRCEKTRVAFWSGESGKAKIKETRRRIMNAKGIHSEDTDCLWSFDLPHLADVRDLDEMEAVITERGIKVAVIDPVYLALMCRELATSSGNLFFMGSLLWKITELSQRTGCTFILIHHFRKSGQLDDKDPAGLEELSASGFGEWARQWILLQRREAYHNDGKHVLWMRTGGSAGHAGLWHVEIDEGLPPPIDDVEDGTRNRRAVSGQWEVSCRTEGAARSQEHAAREAEQMRQDDAVREQVIAVLRDHPDGMTLHWLGEEVDVRRPKIARIIRKLVEDLVAVACQVRRNTRYENGWKLV